MSRSRSDDLCRRKLARFRPRLHNYGFMFGSAGGRLCVTGGRQKAAQRVA
jgi:hypothetical protein